MTIGERIKDSRTIAGLTQAQLAEKSGLAVGTIHQYENNKRQPRVEQLTKIANALNVPVDAFVDNDHYHLHLLALASIAGLKDDISILSVPESEKVEEELKKRDNETQINLNKLKFFIRSKYVDFTESDFIAVRDLINDFYSLNAMGQKKAIERIGELAEIPKYQRQRREETAPAIDTGTDSQDLMEESK